LAGFGFVEGTESKRLFVNIRRLGLGNAAPEWVPRSECGIDLLRATSGEMKAYIARVRQRHRQQGFQGESIRSGLPEREGVTVLLHFVQGRFESF
jgi:hypothetical protein